MSNIQIKKAEFVKGIRGTDDILNDLKGQVAFVGRSNVGKSSLINSLTGQNKLARSSSTPGRTQEINFFLIDEKMYFVDLPGYGFAKISQKQREKLRNLIVWYLTYSGTKPKKVVLIIDANVGLKDFDREMIDLLKKESYDFVVVANKADKIKSSKLHKQTNEVKNQIGDSMVDIVFYSSKTGKGKTELLGKIMN